MTLFFSIMWDCYIEFEAVCTFTMHYSVFTEVFWYSFTCREAQNIITETWYVAKYSSKRGIDLELPRQLKRRWQMRRVILFRRDSEHVQLIYSFQREAQLSSRSMHWGNKWKKGEIDICLIPSSYYSSLGVINHFHDGYKSSIQCGVSLTFL